MSQQREVLNGGAGGDRHVVVVPEGGGHTRNLANFDGEENAVDARVAKDGLESLLGGGATNGFLRAVAAHAGKCIRSYARNEDAPHVFFRIERVAERLLNGEATRDDQPAPFK